MATQKDVTKFKPVLTCCGKRMKRGESGFSFMGTFFDVVLYCPKCNNCEVESLIITEPVMVQREFDL